MAVAKWSDKIQWRGKTFTRRTVAMLKWVEKQSGLTLAIGQGSYNPGGVAASAGTHDREAVDLSIRDYTSAQRTTLDRYMKLAGFAGWHRPTLPGVWTEHYHAIPIGGDLSWLAAAQVIDFDKRRDGLKSHAVDPTFRPKPKRKWSYLLGRPVPRV